MAVETTPLLDSITDTSIICAANNGKDQGSTITKLIHTLDRTNALVLELMSRIAQLEQDSVARKALEEKRSKQGERFVIRRVAKDGK